ncbi:MAG TPA: hypothetical protein VGT40_10600 [Methylomirabilota bacterium]|jgi:hypothetical protein|nr:hypothetical protein [Methylomirabilota bacterium]
MTGQGCSTLTVAAVAGALLLALGGCSRPFVSPIAVPPYRDHAPAPYEMTWKALIRALAIENVPLRAVAKDSGVIASDDFVSPIGVYADCGRLGDVLLEGEALVAFTVFVQPSRNGATDLQVNAKMRTQGYRRGSSGRLKSDPVYQCVSTGRWEANLADMVRRLVKE